MTIKVNHSSFKKEMLDSYCSFLMAQHVLVTTKPLVHSADKKPLQFIQAFRHLSVGGYSHTYRVR